MFSVKWFTPTGVGTIAFPPWQGKFIAVHPHGRGDNPQLGLNTGEIGGSPPRAWGQSVVQIALQGRDRFTPTGVGTIDLWCTTGHNSSVHPHGRGDNPYSGRAERATIGSPPRAWGQFWA